MSMIRCPNCSADLGLRRFKCAACGALIGLGQRSDIPEPPKPRRRGRTPGIVAVAIAAVGAASLFTWRLQNPHRGSARLSAGAIPKEWIRGHVAKMVMASGDFDSAFIIASDPSLHSDRDAHVVLGQLYLFGKSVRRDFSKAFQHFESAALAGDSDAQGQLGMMFLDGLGVPKNSLKAIEWFEKSAKQENAISFAKLGLIYGRGNGVPVDEVKSFKMMLRAAELGFPASQLGVAAAYGMGDGVSADRTRSVYWYRRAAVRGVPQAASALCTIETSLPRTDWDEEQIGIWCGLWRELDSDARDRVDEIESLIGIAKFSARTLDGGVRAALATLLADSGFHPDGKRLADFLRASHLKFRLQGNEVMRRREGWLAYYDVGSDTVFLNPGLCERIYEMDSREMREFLSLYLGFFAHEVRHAQDAAQGFPVPFLEAEQIALAESGQTIRKQVLAGLRPDLNVTAKEMGIACSPWWTCKIPPEYLTGVAVQNLRRTEVLLVQGVSGDWAGFESLSRGIYPTKPSIFNAGQVDSYIEFLSSFGFLPLDGDANGLISKESIRAQISSLKNLDASQKFFMQGLSRVKAAVDAEVAEERTR